MTFAEIVDGDARISLLRISSFRTSEQSLAPKCISRTVLGVFVHHVITIIIKSLARQVGKESAFENGAREIVTRENM